MEIRDWGLQGGSTGDFLQSTIRFCGFHNRQLTFMIVEYPKVARLDTFWSDAVNESICTDRFQDLDSPFDSSRCQVEPCDVGIVVSGS